MLKAQWRLLITAFTFLTRLPVWRWSDPSPEALGRSAVYFPVVGWVLGALGGVVCWVARLGLPPLAAALLGIAATAIVTGCFHEDALADVCDAFGGYDPKKRIEIMHDSRVGSFGVVGTVLMVGLKATTITAIPSFKLVAAFVAAHTLARWSSVFLLWIAPYVQDPQSLAKPLATRATPARLIVATVFLAPALALVGWAGAAALVISVLLSLVAARFFRSWIGGLSGDALGSVNQICEWVTFVAIAWKKIPPTF